MSIYQMKPMPPLRFYVLGVILALIQVSAPGLFANPSGENVVAGGASFDRSGNQLTVQQLTDKAIIDWQNFSIQSHEITKFLQPGASSEILNRVTSGNPSELLGTMQANGKVYLINPAGILVGAGARIDTQSFIASTLDISNAEFMQGGDKHFVGDSSAKIQNMGNINALGGDIFLMARQVENQGSLKAEQGTVGLGAGNEVVLMQQGAERLGVVVGQGLAVDKGIDNKGAIQAVSAELKAAGGNIYALAINNEGTIRASSLDRKGGKLVLKAAGDIQNTGTIDASGSEGGKVVIQSTEGTVWQKGTVTAKADETKGGTVHILGKNVGVTGTVDVSGKNGGGEILVGGDYLGKNVEIQNAQAVYVAPEAKLLANAEENGDGGKVIVWADKTTRAYGTIEAKGGSQSGNGGFIETSGKEYLDANNIHVDASSAHGQAGTWLLDPKNLQISTSGDANLNTTVANVFGASSASSIINNSSLEAALNNGGTGGTNIILTAEDNVQFSANVNYSGSTLSNLTVKAGNDIGFDANKQIASTGSALNVKLYANDSSMDATNTTQGRIVMNAGSKILTNGGNIEIKGDGYSALDGVALSGATLDANGGDITITGRNFSTTGTHNGVSIISSNITSTGSGKVHINGSANPAGSGTGIGIIVKTGSNITTVNGEIKLEGTGGSTFGASSYGIDINASTVRSTGTGEINMMGTGASTDSSSGVMIEGASFIETFDGVMRINGTGVGSNSNGIYLTSALINSTGIGNIFLNGTGASSGSLSYGVHISGPTRVIVKNGLLDVKARTTSTSSSAFSLKGSLEVDDSGTGDISVIAEGASPNSRVIIDGGFNNGFIKGSLGSSGGDSNIFIKTNELMFVNQTTANGLIKGKGELNISPYDNNVQMTLGGSATTGLDISSTSISNLRTNGNFLFSKVIFGRNDLMANIDVDSAIMNNDVKFITGGSINFNNTFNATGRNVYIDATSAVGQNAGAGIVANNLFINGSSITLQGSNNSWGSVKFNSAGSVALTHDAPNPFVIVSGSSAGALNITANGNIIDQGGGFTASSLNVRSIAGNIDLQHADISGLATLNTTDITKNITLKNSGGITFNTLGTTNHLTIIAGGNITQSSGSANVSSIGTFNSTTNGNISLSESGNQFGSLELKGGNIFVREAGGTSLAGVNATGNFNLQSTSSIAQTGAVKVAGVTDLQSASTIILDNVNNEFNVIHDITRNGNMVLVDGANGMSVTGNLFTTTSSNVVLVTNGGDLNLAFGSNIKGQNVTLVSDQDVTGILTANDITGRILVYTDDTNALAVTPTRNFTKNYGVAANSYTSVPAGTGDVILTSGAAPVVVSNNTTTTNANVGEAAAELQNFTKDISATEKRLKENPVTLAKNDYVGVPPKDNEKSAASKSEPKSDTATKSEVKEKVEEKKSEDNKKTEDKESKPAEEKSDKKDDDKKEKAETVAKENARVEMNTPRKDDAVVLPGQGIVLGGNGMNNFTFKQAPSELQSSLVGSIENKLDTVLKSIPESSFTFIK